MRASWSRRDPSPAAQTNAIDAGRRCHSPKKSQKAVATMRERLSSIIDDFLDEMARRPRVNLCDDADGIRHDKTLHQVTTATQHSPRRPPTQGRGQVRPKSPHKSASTKPPAFTRTHQGKHASQKKNPHETRYPTLPSHSKNRLCTCLLYTSPSPRGVEESRMPSSA